MLEEKAKVSFVFKTEEKRGHQLSCHLLPNYFSGTPEDLWMLSFVDLEFQHLPIYFGKKAPVCSAGLQGDLEYNQENSRPRCVI